MKMNPYYYLYYKIYVFTKKLGNWQVAWSAVLGLSFLLIINVILILEKLVDISRFENDRVIVWITGAVILIANFFLFDYKAKYKNLVNKYKNESDISRKFGNSIVLIYVIATLLSIFII
ncbi:hypothetical protein ACFLSE_09200 [Bacteroidota bacterium]